VTDKQAKREATPRPWYVYTGQSNDDGEYDAIAISANGKGPNGGWVGLHVARMPVPDDRSFNKRTRAEINANAELIVRCVNEHDALVAALEEAKALSVLLDECARTALNLLRRHDERLADSIITKYAPALSSVTSALSRGGRDG